MGRKSVAVLDIRSSEVSVIVGARGVNNTFVFTAIHTEEYDGYDENSFLEEAGLADAIVKCVTSVEKICGERLKERRKTDPSAPGKKNTEPSTPLRPEKTLSKTNSAHISP